MIETPLARTSLISATSAAHSCSVSPPGDLVEEQHARSGRERARQFEALAIEQRRAAGRPVRLARRRPQRSSMSSAAIIDMRSRSPAAEGGGHDDVFEHGHAARTAAGSGTSAPGPCRQRRSGGSLVMSRSAKRTRPGVGRDRAGRDAEQRGLAGAVRPDDA